MKEFTGFFDSRAKEIYEGDIVKAVDARCPVEFGVVVFKDGAFWIQGPVSSNDLILLDEWSNCVVVTGNVHSVRDE